MSIVLETFAPPARVVREERNRKYEYCLKNNTGEISDPNYRLGDVWRATHAPV
jgi:hypothetical protein